MPTSNRDSGRRARTQAAIVNGTLNSVSSAPVVTWEFPLLANYRFSLVKPFVEAGPSFRSSGNLNGASPSNHAFAAGLGVEARVWKLKIARQARYLRWARDHNVTYFAPSTVPDQTEFSSSAWTGLHGACMSRRASSQN